MRTLTFDAVIVGGGGAGMRAALQLAQSGQKTALISKVFARILSTGQCVWHLGFWLRYDRVLDLPGFVASALRRFPDCYWPVDSIQAKTRKSWQIN